MFNNELEIENTVINKMNERYLWALILVERKTHTRKCQFP